ncbi:MAG: AMIN domain-containing protein, partial [Desulfomonilaceae bacterium]
MRSPPLKYVFALIAVVMSCVNVRVALAENAGVITSIEVAQAEPKLVIKTKGDPGKVVTSVLRNPNRLVLDFQTASLGKPRRSIAKGEIGIEGVRAAKFKTGTRVVADFNENPIPKYTLQAQSDRVVVLFEVAEGGRAITRAKKQVARPKTSPGAAVRQDRAKAASAPSSKVPLEDWLSQGVESGEVASPAAPQKKPDHGPQGDADGQHTESREVDRGWGEPAASNASGPPAASKEATGRKARDLAQAPPMGSSQDLGSYPNLSPIPRRQVQPAEQPSQSRLVPRPHSIPDLTAPTSRVPMQQPRPPVVPPEPDPRLVHHEITELKFVQVGHNSRLWIKAPDDIDYRVVRVSATKLKLDLINAEIPKKYQQPLRTDQWSTAVDMVIPGSHTIFIQMKEAAPYKVEKKKGVLMVDFAPPRLELPKQKAAQAKMGGAGQSA